jgi:thiol-disulfide isomerase/thioredoxin
MRSITLLAGAVCALLGAGCSGPPQPAAALPAAVAPADRPVVRLLKDPAPMPDIDAQTIDGQRVRLSELRGKVVLVNFWATWCPPCRAEVPDLVRLQEKYQDRLVILGVSEDEGGLDLVKRFVAEHHVNYPVVMSTPEIGKAFPDIVSLPTTIVVDPDGRIAQRHIGMLDPARTEREVMASIGNTTDVIVERVEPDKPEGLPSTAQVKAIPGIDLAKLSAEKRAEALIRLNSEACTCGCQLTVAKCRIDDPTCGVSLPIARRIAAEVAAQ